MAVKPIKTLQLHYPTIQFYNKLYYKLDYCIIHFQGFDWLSGHGMRVMPWLRNNIVTIKLPSGCSCKAKSARI